MSGHRKAQRRSFQHRDPHAADLIQEFLDEHGWSVRRLADEIEVVAKHQGRPDLIVSRRTLDRLFEEGSYGHVPTARVKAAICLVVGVAPWRIWGRGQMPLAYQRELNRGAAA